MEWTKEYISSINTAVGNCDLEAVQPFSHLLFEPIIAKGWIKKIKMLIEKAKEQKVSIKELAFLWPTTSSIRFQIYLLFISQKCTSLTKEERQEISQFFFDMLKIRAIKDVHGVKSNI